MFKDFPFHRVNWKTSIFIIVTSLVALIGSPWYFIKYGAEMPIELLLFQIGLCLFFCTATIMSITLGYHRLFSHLSFKAKWPVKFATLVMGAAAYENSCLSWASDHRHHHKHVDHDGDPYDISRGFFYAHVGWLLFKLDPMPLMNNVNDLKKDKLVMWQDKWVHLIGFIVGIVLPSLVGLWIDGTRGFLGCLLLTGFLRIVIVQHCTFFINSACHTLGSRPYNSGNTARDSAIMALFTCGEGYHNYHHAFQHDYRNGVKSWQFDPTKWMIWLLSKLGLTSNLRRVPDEKIILAEVREAQRLLEKKREKTGIDTADESCPKRKIAEEGFEALSSILSERYALIENAISTKVDLSKSKVSELEREIRTLVRKIGKFKPSLVAK
ncbi:MAG: fatty acid desaturase [Rubritalea sp.]|uniref:acyl-CoA desaturase n=1 Tax=Rubritalea sp. TaxID=2109375 RepID=UPI003241C41B